VSRGFPGAGTFAFDPGLSTGRFAGATGSGTFLAVIDLSQTAGPAMTVVLDGSVSY